MVLVAGTLFIRHGKQRLQIGSDVVPEFTLEQVSIHFFGTGITINDTGCTARIRCPDTPVTGVPPGTLDNPVLSIK